MVARAGGDGSRLLRCSCIVFLASLAGGGSLENTQHGMHTHALFSFFTTVQLTNDGIGRRTLSPPPPLLAPPLLSFGSRQLPPIICSSIALRSSGGQSCSLSVATPACRPPPEGNCSFRCLASRGVAGGEPTPMYDKASSGRPSSVVDLAKFHPVRSSPLPTRTEIDWSIDLRGVKGRTSSICPTQSWSGREAE